MPLNLITDAWIPVRLHDKSRRIIAPHQMADSGIAAPDWPRADFNIACYELLIGLLLLADPPTDKDDWQARVPDEDSLRDALLPYADAFNLTGEGPCFLQERLETNDAPKPVDMLFIDSAGENAAKQNKDMMTRRGRYDALSPAMAAMALYTLQAFAPSGGAGNRTSMRGGGPLVTLVDPGQGLWSLIRANVPFGTPATLKDLPWMKPVRVSQAKGSETYPKDAHAVEAFFGMPRRLRLTHEGEAITGVIQKPYGTNYAGWTHPTSPYYRQKPGSELLPAHPKPGPFGYRNWLGIVAQGADREAGTEKVLRHRATVIDEWHKRKPRTTPGGTLLLAGWAMNNMSPVTFMQSVQPIVDLPEHHDLLLDQMIRSADQAAHLLNGALKHVLSDGVMRDALREEFFARTQSDFDAKMLELTAVNLPAGFADRWLSRLRRVALDLFDLHAMPGLHLRSANQQRAIVNARRSVLAIGGKKFEDLRRLADGITAGEDA